MPDPVEEWNAWATTKKKPADPVAEWNAFAKGPGSASPGRAPSGSPASTGPGGASPKKPPEVPLPEGAIPIPPQKQVPGSGYLEGIGAGFKEGFGEAAPAEANPYDAKTDPFKHYYHEIISGAGRGVETAGRALGGLGGAAVETVAPGASPALKRDLMGAGVDVGMRSAGGFREMKPEPLPKAKPAPAAPKLLEGPKQEPPAALPPSGRSGGLSPDERALLDKIETEFKPGGPRVKSTIQTPNEEFMKFFDKKEGRPANEPGTMPSNTPLIDKYSTLHGKSDMDQPSKLDVEWMEKNLFGGKPKKLKIVPDEEMGGPPKRQLGPPPEGPAGPGAPQGAGAARKAPDYITEAVAGYPKKEAAAREAKYQGANIAQRIGMRIKDIFSPHTADAPAERATGVMRETQGVANRDTATADAEFNPFRRQVAQLPEPDRWRLINYIERRSTGTASLSPELKPIADSLRTEMRNVRRQLEQLERTAGTASRPGMNFIDDYIAHEWEDPAAARRFFGEGSRKRGSSGFTKKREHPTYSDGIAAGLKPKTSDPLEMSMRYIDNAHRFIAANKAFEIGRRTQDVKWYAPKFVPEGFMKLNKVRPNHLGQEAYAPEGWARIWNNFHGNGYFDMPVGRDLFAAARSVSNAMTMLKLGLSGFHGFTMANEALISQLASGLGDLARGRIKEGVKGVAKAPLAPFDVATGKKFQEQYQRVANHGPDFAKIADLAARANFRPKGGHLGDFSIDRTARQGYGSLLKSIERGTAKIDMIQGLKGFGKGISSPKTAASTLWHGVQRVLRDTASPIFEYYVPRMKSAAFYNKMKSWLEQNPTADDAAQVRMARTIADSIDNRFGEMNQDNVFWNNTLKQSLQVAMTSYSWTLGTIREIGGGVIDFPKEGLKAITGKGGSITPKMEYVMALGIGTALLNSVYQMLMTGEPPKDVNDAMAPRSGGTIPATQYDPEMPERARLPGYMKDVFGWWNDPKQEAMNKLSPMIQAGKELITGKDWRGDPTYDPQSGIPGWLLASGKTILEAFTPISAEQVGKEKEGTGIGTAQRLMGISPATMPLQNPEGYAGMKGSQAEKAWETKMYHDATAAKQSGDMEKYAQIMAEIRRRKFIQGQERRKNPAGAIQ